MCKRFEEKNRGTFLPVMTDIARLGEARKVLNQFIVWAWKDLKDEVIMCKKFEEKNRGTFDQVMTDIVRLGDLSTKFEEKNRGTFDQVMTDMAKQSPSRRRERS